MAQSLLDRIELDELDALDVDDEPLDPDPVPAESTRRKPKTNWKTAVKPAGRPVSVTTKKRIAAELHAYAELAALGVIMRDPTCGAVLHEQAKPIADAIADILADYPDLAAKFIASGVIGKWIKLLVTVKPVAQVVWQHHIVKNVEEGPADDRDDVSRYAPFRAAA